VVCVHPSTGLRLGGRAVREGVTRLVERFGPASDCADAPSESPRWIRSTIRGNESGLLAAVRMNSAADFATEGCAERPPGLVSAEPRSHESSAVSALVPRRSAARGKTYTGMAPARHRGHLPTDRKRDAMHIDIVLLHIAIALAIMALAAHAADARNSG
jgi:hypothetical protein